MHERVQRCARRIDHQVDVVRRSRHAMQRARDGPGNHVRDAAGVECFDDRPERIALSHDAGGLSTG